jgi:hypothetical protein
VIRTGANATTTAATMDGTGIVAATTITIDGDHPGCPLLRPGAQAPGFFVREHGTPGR